MISEIKMWACSCDICKKDYELWDGCIALNDESAIRDDVEESEWSITEDGKTYCPDCHHTSWDEETDILYAHTKDTQNSGAKILGKVK